MIEGFKRVLVVSAHPDDAELGAGGTIARLVNEGATVLIHRLSRCTESLGEDGSTALLAEATAAAEVLGVQSVQCDFPVRRFAFKRQAVLDALIAQRDAFQPDLVLTHGMGDRHQDHDVARREVERAFRCSLLGYEAPTNQRTFSTQLFIRLAGVDIDTKIAAVKCYASQAHRPYMAEDFNRGLARVRGVQCGATWAEAFEVIRLVS